MDELDLFRNFRRGVATPSAEARRRASARLESDLDEAGGREKAARLRHGGLRWPLVALAAVVLVGGLLVTPAVGLGDRLLSLIQSKQSALDVQAPAWSRDGQTIVFVSWRDGNSEVYVMNADGSGKRNLTRDRAQDDYPTWSPDGRRLAFLRGPQGFCSYQLYVVNADSSGLRRLTLRVPEGTPETTGRCKGKADQLVWSPDGRTIYFGRYLVRTDGSGARRLPYFPLTGWSRAVWSPDGTRIAFAAKSPGQPPTSTSPSHSDIYVMNADGSGKRRLTHDARSNAEPAWSPDGRRIAFKSSRDGNSEIYVMNADGSGKRNLTRNPAQDGRPSWSPDGRRIAFLSDRDGRLEAHVMNADGSGQRSLALQER